MTQVAGKELLLSTPRGEVRIRPFCTSREISRYTLSGAFSGSDDYRSLYTRKESLIRDANRPDANVVLALSAGETIIGFGVLAYPDPEERWFQLGPRRMMEVRVIEVDRGWRGEHLADHMLSLVVAHPRMEEIIAYMIGYSWTWDLQGSGLDPLAYRRMLVNLFSGYDFQELETNEPNVCLRPENLFMCRLGGEVPETVVEQFNWLRFGIAPEPRGIFPGQIQPHAEPGRPRSLFVPLEEENLTSLGIYYDWKTNRLKCQAGRHWDTRVDWREYQRTFTSDRPLTSDTQVVNHDQTRRLFERRGLSGYLDDIIALLKRQRHMGLECFFDARCGIRFFHFIHTSQNPWDHIHHARRTGGFRWYSADYAEISLVEEGLRMSAAMSYKNLLAETPFGGAALAIQTDAPNAVDSTSAGFIGFVLDRIRCLAYPDLGFPSEIVDLLRDDGYTVHIIGGKDNYPGGPGALTAYGVYLALEQAAIHHFGRAGLVGKKIVVQGLGAVGYPLVTDHLIQSGGEIHVSDNDMTLVEKLRSRFGDRIQTISPEDVLAFEGDVLVPCGRGGILKQTDIDGLSYRIIVGAAENILAAGSEEDEMLLAEHLENNGVLFQVDWLVNGGGIIAAVDAYLHGGGASSTHGLDRVRSVCQDMVRRNLRTAGAHGISPTKEAYQHYRPRIYT